MDRRIIVFSMEGCPHCVTLKGMLNELNIKYTTVDIDKKPELWDKVSKFTDNDYVPVIVVRNPEGVRNNYIVPDKDYDELNEAVDLLKQYLL